MDEAMERLSLEMQLLRQVVADLKAALVQHVPAIRQPERRNNGTKLEVTVTALAVSTGITVKAELARILGVHRSNLSRMPMLDKAIDTLRRMQD